MKSYSVFIMPTAKEGLLEIAEYIAIDNPAKAIDFIDEMMESLINTLSIFPYGGRVVDHLDLNEEIRMSAYRSYNSYYRIMENQKRVDILFIFNGSRDIENLINSL